jgi:hypothetical protein
VPANKSATPRTGQYGSGKATFSPQLSSSPAAGDDGVDPPLEPDPDRPFVEDLDSVGQAARAILQPEPFTEIVVEIDYVPGREPSENAKRILAARLKEVTRKTVKFLKGNQIPQAGTWSLDDIATLSLQRNSKSLAPSLSLYVAYLDGNAAENRFALGRVVASTVIAIFPDVMKKYTPPNVDLADVESAGLVHELGHLLGLINLIYDSPRPHGDPNNPQHSKNPNSVMYHAFEQSFGASVYGAPPSQFDADDLADLADLAAGRL